MKNILMNIILLILFFCHNFILGPYSKYATKVFM